MAVGVERMRTDQDIRFEIKGVPILMRLDTTAPFNRWILTPLHEGDMKESFANVIRSTICPLFPSNMVCVTNRSASIAQEEGASIAHNIFVSLPDWDGESLEGMTGAEELAEFLLFLQDFTEITEFRRGDGQIIEFKKYLID